MQLPLIMEYMMSQDGYRGRISGKNFHIASPREISFMKKNYIPQFNTEKLERYLKML